MKPSYVIFDIDGVIVDSEQLHFNVLLKVIPSYTNNIKPEMLIGLSLPETLDYLGVPKAEHLELTDKIIDTYNKELSHLYIRDGIKNFIIKLINSSIPYGFVSTAPKNICLANLKLLDILNLSEINLVSGDDVEKTKPHPDPYLKMLQMLKADPKHTIVIEDTDIGIKSATLAGITKVYGWPHSLSNKEEYKEATKVIKTISDITL